MYWLVFLFFTVVLYMPPLNLASLAIREFAAAQVVVPLIGWPISGPTSFALAFATSWLVLGTVLCWLEVAAWEGGAFSRWAHRLSEADAGGIRWALVIAGAAALLCRAIFFPWVNSRYGTAWSVSPEATILAVLAVLAEVVRLYENNAGEIHARDSWRITWLRDHGYRYVP
jgi:hypothetical protein